MTWYILCVEAAPLPPATRHLASVSGLVTEVRVTRLGGGPAVLLPLDHVQTQCCMLGLVLWVPSTNTTLLSSCSAQVCRWQHQAQPRSDQTRKYEARCPALPSPPAQSAQLSPGTCGCCVYLTAFWVIVVCSLQPLSMP